MVGKELMPSRELDALVAKKVMGWRVEAGRDEDREDIWRLKSSSGQLVSVSRVSQDSLWDKADVPPFSTDIAAAWQVVCALAEKGFAIQIASHESQPKAFTVCFSSDEPLPLNTQSGFLDRVPAMICQAALRVLGH